MGQAHTRFDLRHQARHGCQSFTVAAFADRILIMALAQLVLCTVSIYASFLLWALLQERLTTTPYTLPISLQHPTATSRNEFFKSPLVLNALQALCSTVVAAAYLLLRAYKTGNSEPLVRRLGLDALTPSGAQRIRKTSSAARGSSHSNGRAEAANGHAATGKEKAAMAEAAGAGPIGRVSPLLLRYVQIAASQSISSLLALHSLSHGISYPTLTLAKSCKLVPVLFANVLLYRRRFAPYKYIVVLLVTVGISMFMLFGNSGGKHGKGSGRDSSGRSSTLGLMLLLGNQALDGITNSTQDEVFGTYALSGPKMMLVMNAISTLLMGASLLLPVPRAIGGAGAASSGELAAALAFVHRHPEILRDLFGYALAGAVGQVAIFETLERFGSLTLVAITVSMFRAGMWQPCRVWLPRHLLANLALLFLSQPQVTRKLFTMLLSIVVYKHTLQPAQWLGVLVVFVGLGIEAREKQREGLAKRVLAEKSSKRAVTKDA